MKMIRLLLIVLLLTSIPAGAASHPLPPTGHSPRITAHRGASSAAPENTLPAILAAIEAQADFVEVDVRETADGIPVLCHDSSLLRTAGKEGELQDYTYAELSSLDFGGWFSDSCQKVPIPTLAQALEACQGHIRMNIELKSGEGLAEKVLELLETYDMEEQVIISSVSLPDLERIKEKKPGIPTGYIASSPCPKLLREESVDFFSVSASWVTADFVEQAHRLGKEVHIWTVDTPEALLDAKALDADNVITDCPDLAGSLFAREP